MSETFTPTAPAEAGVESDLSEAVRTVLEKSEEPVTLPRLRSSLPGRLRSIEIESLAEVLRRQVAANVLYQYPKYRSPHDRFWDRPMPVHVAHLVRNAVESEPLALPELRRKLPDYAKNQVEAVVQEEVAHGRLYQHPPASKRTGPRFSVRRPEPREYLRHELTQVFHRLEQLGFTQSQLRHGALELLHEEEWASPPPAETPTAKTTPAPAELSQPRTAHPDPLLVQKAPGGGAQPPTPHADLFAARPAPPQEPETEDREPPFPEQAHTERAPAPADHPEESSEPLS